MSSWRSRVADVAEDSLDRLEEGFAFDLTEDDRIYLEDELTDDELFQELALALHRLDLAERDNPRHTAYNRKGEEVSLLGAHNDVEALVDKRARQVVSEEIDYEDYLIVDKGESA